MASTPDEHSWKDAADRAAAASLARHREAQQRVRDEQLAAGECSVLPLPNVSTRPFRSELTIEGGVKNLVQICADDVKWACLRVGENVSV